MLDDEIFLLEAFKHERPGVRLLAIEDCAIPIATLEINLLTQQKREIPIVDEIILKLLRLQSLPLERIGELLGLEKTFVIEVLTRLMSDNYIERDSKTRSVKISRSGMHLLEIHGESVPVNHSENAFFNRLTWKLEAPRNIRLLSQKAAKQANWIILPSVQKSRVGNEDLDLEDIRDFFGLKKNQLVEILSLQSIRQKGYTKYVHGKLFAYVNQLGLVEPHFALNGIFRQDITSAFLASGRDMESLGFTNISDVNLLDLHNLERLHEDDLESDRVFDEIFVSASSMLDHDNGDATEEQVTKDVETFEHVKYFDEALTMSKSRILIVSPWIRGIVVNDAFISHLQDRLLAGVKVDIAYGYKRDQSKRRDEYRGCHPHALRMILGLAQKFDNLSLHELDDVHAKILVFDNTVIKTSFNWLSFKGDPSRTYRFESGTLTRGKDYADEVYERTLLKIPELLVDENKRFLL
jgi:hypothetical protein